MIKTTKMMMKWMILTMKKKMMMTVI